MDETEYAFKHALTQEVAYNSLLVERRKSLHERVGAAIEALYEGRLEDHLRELAHHYQCSANTAKALEYLGRAGQQALQRSSHAEAIGLFTSALELLRTLPETHERLEQELALQLGLGAALTAAKGWAAPEVGRGFARARELCREIGETPHQFQALAGLFVYYDVRGEMEPALELAKQLLSIAQSAQDAAFLPAAHHAMAEPLYLMGQFTPARSHVELSVSLYDPGRYPSHGVPYFGVDIAVHSLTVLATSSWALGFPDKAIESDERAVALARELAHPLSLCFALALSAIVHSLRGEAQATSKNADVMFHLADEHGFQGLLALGILIRGVALVVSGQADEGITQLREGLGLFQAGGGVNISPWFLAFLAEAYGIIGLPDEGFAVVAEALALAESTGLGAWEAELYRLKGELTLQRPEAGSNSQIREEAESYFRQAIEVARRQSAKSWELRATTSLARLLRERSRRDEARAMLSEIYNWFTEGFDTADLRDAKSLLDELAR
jgi:predicted ATPase